MAVCAAGALVAPISQTLHHCRPFSALRNSMSITDALSIPHVIPLVLTYFYNERHFCQ